jgi:hypothetical protein
MIYITGAAGIICRHGDDMPEITGRSWGKATASQAARSTDVDNL